MNMRSASVTAASIRCMPTMSPMTSVRRASMSTSWRTRHSIEAGLSWIRGTSTLRPGASSSPASIASSMLASKSMAVTFMRRACAADTRLTTNSPRAAILRAVSLRRPSREPTQKHRIGGSPDITLKKENGATLSAPRASRELTQAMGRGSTVECMSLLRCSPLSACMSKYMGRRIQKVYSLPARAGSCSGLSMPARRALDWCSSTRLPAGSCRNSCLRLGEATLSSVK